MPTDPPRSGPPITPSDDGDVDIRREHHRFLLVRCSPPAAAAAPLPVPLPPLAGGDFDCMSQILRVGWNRHRCFLSWRLYLDPRERIWYPRLSVPKPQGMYALSDPPAAMAETVELCWPQLSRREPPRKQLVLAGSYGSVPVRDSAALQALAPAHDGLHLFWRVGDWASVAAFVTAGGVRHPLAVHDAVAEQAAAGGEDVFSPPWITDRP
jgi:hypothetical protein